MCVLYRDLTVSILYSLSSCAIVLLVVACVHCYVVCVAVFWRKKVKNAILNCYLNSRLLHYNLNIRVYSIQNHGFNQAWLSHAGTCGLS